MKLSKKPNKKELKTLLGRGVTNIIDRAHLEKALSSGRQLRMKLGIDPTSPDLHLGHAVVLRKLRGFQNLGHKAVLIIGDFTAKVGDPSGKSITRPLLDEKTIKKNMRDYIAQAKLILDVKKAEIRYNSEWLEKLSFAGLFKLAGLVSLNQILEREDFSKRLAAHKPIRVYELFYPILQAYDSVAIKADVELGGNDQLLNNLAGRALMGRLGLPPQDVLTVQLLEGTDGKEKMSKSLGNYIAVTDEPNDMFGKVMAVRDELIGKYFLLCTDIDEAEIKKIEKDIKSGKLNPRDAKSRLAREIVSVYHGKKAGQKAEEEFNRVFREKKEPEDVQEFHFKKKEISVVDLLVLTKLASSRSEARRLINQAGVKINQRKIIDQKSMIRLSSAGSIIQAGKRKFVRVFKK